VKTGFSKKRKNDMRLIAKALIIVLLVHSSVSGQIEGLIIDKTRTKVGHDFYEIFYLKIQKMPGMEYFNIIVDEFVDPQFGSRISVSINEIVLYQNFVSSRFDDIEEKANEASETINYFFINWKEYQKLLEEEKIR